MSFECVNWAYDQQGMKSGAKFVLVTLANICDENGLCYPGQPYLAARTGLTDRTVLEHLGDLEDRGLIKRWRRTLVSGQRTSDLCQLQVPWIETQPAPDAVRPVATRKKPPAYPKNTTGLPEEISGNTSEIHQGSAREGERSRRTRLPKDWQPDLETIIWAQQKGFSHEEIGREFESFADSARAHGRVYADWQAAFKNWLHKAPEFAAKPARSVSGNGRRGSGFIGSIARATSGDQP